jgi:glycosyltransferase involved in cell wall biosynthesis
MKVVFCNHISLSYGGGGEKWTITVAKYLRSRGYDVKVYALPYTPNNRHNLVPSKILEDIPYYEGWRHNVNADVAYVFYNPLAYLFFRCRGCIRIAGLHSNVYFMPKTPPISYGTPAIISRILYKIIGKYDISTYDIIHIVNKACEMKGVKRKVIYIPNFVNTKIYKPIGRKYEKFTVLFVGRPSWQKGWDIFLQVAKMLKSNESNIDILWAGGTYSNPDNLVRGLGYISDELKLSRIYSMAHITLYPSLSDLFPLTIAESLASGTPVITTPIETHKSMKLPLIYASTAEEFAKKIMEIKNMYERNPKEYSKLITEGRRAVEELYDIEKVLPRFEMFINILGSHKGT